MNKGTHIATWQLIDKAKNTGVCSYCHRQDHIDHMAKFCRYCGSYIRMPMKQYIQPTIDGYEAVPYK